MWNLAKATNAYAFTVGQMHTQMYMLLGDLPSYPPSPSEASPGRHSIRARFCDFSSMWLELGGLAPPDGPSIEQLDNSINIAENPQEQDLQTVPRFVMELNLYSVINGGALVPWWSDQPQRTEYCREYSSWMSCTCITFIYIYMHIPPKQPSTS